jgi:hypothetical protein
VHNDNSFHFHLESIHLVISWCYYHQSYRGVYRARAVYTAQENPELDRDLMWTCQSGSVSTTRAIWQIRSNVNQKRAGNSNSPCGGSTYCALYTQALITLLMSQMTSHMMLFFSTTSNRNWVWRDIASCPHMWPDHIVVLFSSPAQLYVVAMQWSHATCLNEGLLGDPIMISHIGNVYTS